MKNQRIIFSNLKLPLFKVDSFIKDKAVKVYGFDKDFESFLGVTPVPSNRNDLKPLNVLKNNEDGLIAQEKIDELKTIILGLID